VNYQEVINIASKFDAKGFKQAETALGKLNGTAKKLAGSFGLAFGAAAITRYGKAAVKAFAEDEAAATRLTRAVTNLGIGFANPAITDYISELERSAAIADDVLRPAFQSLLTTTGSLTQSQKLLNDAITISRASGIDLATVSEDLAKGYVGITKGLVKYNTGLTKAEIQSKSFSEILGILLTQSAGAASDYLDTTAYSLDVLAIATGNASEIIGGGLVDAFARVGGGTEASDAAIAIENIAKALAAITVATGTAVGGVTNVFKTLKNLPKNIFQGFAGAQTGVNLGATTSKPQLSPTEKQRNAALAKLEAAAAARAKKLAASQKAIVKSQEDAFKLTKAKSIFDLEKISIEAALKGNITDEERIRLKLMKAIADENADAIDKLLEQLKTAQTKTAEMQKLLDTIKTLEIKDPFGTWKIDPLTASINELVKSMFSVQSQIQASGKEWSSFATTVGATVIKPNLTEWNSSFGAAGSKASAAAEAALKAQQDALNAQTKAAQDALTAGSKAQQDAFAAQLKAQQDALTAQSAAQLQALKARLADEAAAYKEAADAAAALFDATAILGTNDSATRNAGMLALQAAEQAKAAQAALAAAEQALANNANNVTSGSKIEITVNTGIGDPNAIAEAIQEVLNGAYQRGTLEIAGTQ